MNSPYPRCDANWTVERSGFSYLREVASSVNGLDKAERRAAQDKYNYHHPGGYYVGKGCLTWRAGGKLRTKITKVGLAEVTRLSKLHPDW